MKKYDLEEFLDVGWYSEATLYYKGYTYWCESWYGEQKDKPFHFFVYKYRSVICKNDQGEIYTKRLVVNHDVVDYSTIFEMYSDDKEEIKETFFSAKIFEGKSFWEAEKDIEWYDEV